MSDPKTPINAANVRPVALYSLNGIQFGAKVVKTMQLASIDSPGLGAGGITQVDAMAFHPAGIVVRWDNRAILVPYAQINHVACKE